MSDRVIIAIDAVGNKNGGGAVVLLDLLAAALAREELERVVVFASPQRTRDFEFPRHPKLSVLAIANGRLHWAWWGLDRALQDISVDAFLGLNGIGTVRRDIPSVLFVQQSLPYSAEALRTCSCIVRGRMQMLRWLTRRAACAADHICVQSRPMQEMIAATFHIPSDRVSVFSPTAPVLPPSVEVQALSGTVSGGLLLYVGSASAHKNLAVIGRAVKRISKQLRPAWAATLPPDHPVCARSEAISLGSLTRGQLHAAYKAATVLVMPSLVETVGLPMLEAMRVGTPVIAADRPYAHAVCGDAALYFDPHSERDLAAQITRLLQDAGLLAGMIRRGYDVVRRLDATDPYGAMVSKIVEIARTHRRQGGSGVELR